MLLLDPAAAPAPEVVLPPVPASVADASGTPRFGTYAGELARVDLGALSGRWALPLALRPFKRKRWLYSFVATQEVIALSAVVDLGYGANAFAVAYDLKARRALADLSMLGVPGVLSAVGDCPAEGAHARFDTLGARLRVRREAGASEYGLEVSAAGVRTGSGPLRLRARLHTQDAAPALTVVAPVEGDGRVNVTQKRSALLTSGTLEADGRTWSLEGGVGGMDYTQGYLARHTAWRWAFAAGRLPDGTPVGLNLVEGFNDSASEANENALWVGGRLFPLSRARFGYTRGQLLEPWTVRTEDGAVDLRFEPLHVHREEKNLKVVVSHFAQPLGLFTGTLRVGGRTLEVSALPGVTEEQDMRW
ncbi:DUF2804 domain-containing protein [Aggregicoccus sp. 17bor-14]|uniref:DUF2804 domain-containing protein n=1 Tax=Myxococcaceae TaxID=31 RepID=UPI00129C1B79|nr:MULTISPECIES: DUF2804 domain-containing protein [Myxococcaceae]MBF5041514.1 DUF2804 domain-containing protein [Simulacricoccus sp. 17bor-14]MRI87298.1 DUF2804 domain-containing protein [Aggregicoccus sp. 17bor-14]